MSPSSRSAAQPLKSTSADAPALPVRECWRGPSGQGRVATPFAYESTSTIVTGLASVAEPPAPSMTDCRPPDWPGVGQLPFTEQVLEMNRSPASVNLTPGLLGAW